MAVLYLLLNFVFLRTLPLSQLTGKIEVGALSANYIFGGHGGLLISAMICVLLVSTISAMVMAGPRVLQVAGEDLPRLRPLAKRTRGGAPLRAIMLQQLLAIVIHMVESIGETAAHGIEDRWLDFNGQDLFEIVPRFTGILHLPPRTCADNGDTPPRWCLLKREHAEGTGEKTVPGCEIPLDNIVIKTDVTILAGCLHDFNKAVSTPLLVNGLESHIGIAMCRLEAVALVELQEAPFELGYKENCQHCDLLNRYKPSNMKWWRKYPHRQGDQKERDGQKTGRPQQREHELSEEIGARCAKQINRIDHLHAAPEVSSPNPVTDILAQPIGDKKRQKKEREGEHLDKQPLQLDVEKMRPQVIEMLAGQHGKDRKDHRTL